MFTKIKNTSAVDKRWEHKIPKEDGPAPGLYQVEEAVVKTQWVTRKPPVDKQRTVGFIEKFQKLHKHAPGVGTYDKVESAYNRLSRSPPSITVRRH
jgi:hypothetical protein